MKWLAALCLILFSLAALADDARPDVKPLRQTPSNVTIINGKRFFSLQNARRFTGDLNNPRALSVMHHPHDASSAVARHTAHAPFSGGQIAPPPTTGNTTDKDKVLSIFAPDDKTPLPSSTK